MQPLRTPGQVECRVRLRLCAVGRDGAPLFTGCASTYGVQFTVAAWSFLVLHDTVSVAFTASHTSREFTIYRIGACIGENARLSTGTAPRASGAYRARPPERPRAFSNGRTPRLHGGGLGAGGAGAENFGENRHLRGSAGSCAVVVDRVSSLIRVHTTIHSSESHRVSATTRPAQPNSSAIRARRMRCSQIQSHLTAE